MIGTNNKKLAESVFRSDHQSSFRFTHTCNEILKKFLLKKKYIKKEKKHFNIYLYSPRNFELHLTHSISMKPIRIVFYSFYFIFYYFYYSTVSSICISNSDTSQEKRNFIQQKIMISSFFYKRG